MCDNIASRYPLEILVAEDSLLNQKSLTRLLNHWGYSVTAAENTEDMLHIMALQSFNLIFLELHGSEFDNFKIISYPFPAESRPFIIALTRFGQLNDYGAYNELGFDDYLGKPVSEKQLQCSLRHWHYRYRHAEEILPLQQFNTAELLARVGYNPDILRELTELFDEDGQRLLAQIQHSLGSQNISGLKKAVHELKGVCCTLSAKKLRLLAAEIEQPGNEGNTVLFSRLEGEYRAIQQAMGHLIQHF